MPYLVRCPFRFSKMESPKIFHIQWKSFSCFCSLLFFMPFEYVHKLYVVFMSSAFYSVVPFTNAPAYLYCFLGWRYPWTLTVFCWRWRISFDSCLFVLLSGLAITHERLQYFIEYAMYKFVSSVALPSISMMSLNQWIVLACIRGFMYKYLVCFGWGQRLKFLI